jgi:hypothetical protein
MTAQLADAMNECWVVTTSSPELMPQRPKDCQREGAVRVRYRIAPAEKFCHLSFKAAAFVTDPIIDPVKGRLRLYAIHLYTRLHRRPPTETDMQEYFPSAHLRFTRWCSRPVLRRRRGGVLRDPERVAVGRAPALAGVLGHQNSLQRPAASGSRWFSR